MDLQKLYFHKLTGQLRIVGYPDASYKNNADLSSQRPQVIFISEPRRFAPDAAPAAESGKRSSGAAPAAEKSNFSQNDFSHATGSLIDCECTKIRRTTLSTTVAEL